MAKISGVFKAALVTAMAFSGVAFAARSTAVAAITGPRGAVHVSLRTLDDCEVVCVQGSCVGEHRAYNDQNKLDVIDHGYHSMCLEGVCAWLGGTYHAQCHPSDDFDRSEYERVRDAIDAGDMRTVANLVAAHPDVVLINERRVSVQIAGCRSTVVANFPLSAVQISELSELAN